MNLKPTRTNNGRRLFLKAAGVSIALPWLESAAAPVTKAVGEPIRMVCISSALGMNPEAFFPKSFDRGYELSPSLQALAELRDDMTVISHMDHPSIYTKHGAMNSFLSGVDAKKAGPGENISVDQVAAAHVGYRTRFPSVHISLGGSQGMSWTGSGIKVREESDPHRPVSQTIRQRTRLPLETGPQGWSLISRASVLDLVRRSGRSGWKRVESTAADRSKT